MPVIAAYQIVVPVDWYNPHQKARSEVSLDPPEGTGEEQMSVHVVRVRLDDAYTVERSHGGSKLIFPVADHHASGLTLSEAIDKGIARMLD